MIKVQLFGGLGNQMFQYALGRHLAILNHDTELVLDLSYIQSKLPFKRFSTPMKYELDIFNLNIDTQHLFFSGKFVYPFAKLESYLKTKKNSNQYNLISDYGLKFNPDFLEEKEDIFIQGSFQSDLYFKAIDSIIREDFTFNLHHLSSENLSALHQIKNCNAVSIHIRRGDYISLKKNSNKFRSLALDYYKNAIKLLVSKISNPIYFVFSDDIEWTKENLKLANAVFINHNQKKESYWDMFLMSQCQHNIIANSTFSWWGAWLNTNNEKIVIAPKIWFLTDYLNQNDIVPESWITI